MTKFEKSQKAHQRLYEMHYKKGMKAPSKSKSEKRHFVLKDYHADIIHTQQSSRQILPRSIRKQRYVGSLRRVLHQYMITHL